MRSENLDLSMSVPHNPRNYGAVDDQTFHTPSFGDEEFDIPAMHRVSSGQSVQNSHIQYASLHAAPQMGMMNPAQDGLAPPGGAPSYQQPLYLQEPHTPLSQHTVYTSSGSTPAGNYIIQQQPGGAQQLLMMQPAVMGAPISSMGAPSAPAVPGYARSPQRASPPTATTSEDSDDSHHAQLPGDAESLLPIHYCSASRQQSSAHHQVSMGAVKRLSPEPADSSANRAHLPKKPKAQKKKKKRDPNEPQKPVSAYALFFRDTQAAIKGQNPNASFGEVSKIVASMWDGLDSDHKSVYKQKTEAAKKEYLKALAAYRASLVSKGGEKETQPMYNSPATPASGSPYSGYYANQGYSATPQGYSPQPYPPTSAQNYQSGQSPQGYPSGQSTQGYPPGQSPQNYGSGQSPANYNNAHSPTGFRGPPSHSPPHHPHHMQYAHHTQALAGHTMHAPPQQHALAQMQQMQHQQQLNQQQQQQIREQHVTQQQQQQQQQTQQQSHQHVQQSHQQSQQQPHQQSQQQPHQQSQQSNNQQHNNQSPQQQTQPQVIQQNLQQQNQPQSNQQPSQQHAAQQVNENSQKRASPDQCSNGSEGSSGGSAGSNGSCIRRGCTNPAVANSEWEDEYCSNECVVSHCRDVFNSWVASNNNQSQNFSAVK